MKLSYYEYYVSFRSLTTFAFVVKFWKEKTGFSSNFDYQIKNKYTGYRQITIFNRLQLGWWI